MMFRNKTLTGRATGRDFLFVITSIFVGMPAMLFASGAQAAVSCTDTITANVVVLDAPTVFNRLGAQNPNWISYALERHAEPGTPAEERRVGIDEIARASRAISRAIEAEEAEGLLPRLVHTPPDDHAVAGARRQPAVLLRCQVEMKGIDDLAGDPLLNREHVFESALIGLGPQPVVRCRIDQPD